MSLQPARRVSRLERTLIRQIFDAAPPDAINLGLGQPDLETPDTVRLAGIRGIAEGRTRYTSTAGDPQLRDLIAERYRPFGAERDGVMVTCGSQEALFAACLTLTDPGDELLYPDPGYPAYPTVARLVGAEPRPYRLRADNGFRIEAEQIAALLTERTRLVVLCAPSNPAGACHDESELRRLIALLEQRGIGWLSDEIYSGYCYLDRYASPSEFSRHGVVISGLSKDLCMTGWRIGWLVGPPNVVSRCIAVHQHLVTCASSVSQVAAVAALGAAGQQARLGYLERFRGRRELMSRELAAVPRVSFERPDGAFYYFVDVSAYGNSLALARRILDRCNVITIPGEAFGEGGAGYLRLSFAADESQIVEGLRRIAGELVRT